MMGLLGELSVQVKDRNHRVPDPPQTKRALGEEGGSKGTAGPAAQGPLRVRPPTGVGKAGTRISPTWAQLWGRPEGKGKGTHRD